MASQMMVLCLNDEALQRIITDVADQLRTLPARLEQGVYLQPDPAILGDHLYQRHNCRFVFRRHVFV